MSISLLMVLGVGFLLLLVGGVYLISREYLFVSYEWKIFGTMKSFSSYWLFVESTWFPERYFEIS